MPLNGVAKVCLFKDCSKATANVSVPFSIPGFRPAVVGVGGTLGTGSEDTVMVIGAPWTAGTAAVGTVTQAGFQHGPASATSSTAQASGAIRLVTPIFVTISNRAGGSNDAFIPSFAILDLHFVPEPSTSLLLGGGIAALVLFGRTKRG
jgi:hypothetical protein